MKSDNTKYSFEDLLDIMKQLRAPDGCPWDREQNHESLLEYLIEESSEYIDAVQQKDLEGMCEELGDVLLQVVFHAQLAKEAGTFTIEDVIQGVSAKMVRRHPHVFGDTHVDTSDEVLDRWEKIKATEKEKAPTSLMDGMAESLPALSRSDKMQKRAAKAGFDWPSPEPIYQKMNEELEELKTAVEQKDQDAIEDEMGDVLFTAVNLARAYGVQPELALRRANKKFESRFREVEKQASAQEMKKMNLDELDQLWERAKKQLKNR